MCHVLVRVPNDSHIRDLSSHSHRDLPTHCHRDLSSNVLVRVPNHSHIRDRPSMSLPECKASPNSTICLLPELLEELHKSETVFPRNTSDMVRLLSF